MVGLLLGAGAYSALAMVVIMAALVSLGVAFLMAGRGRPSSRRSPSTDRVALIDALTEYEWRTAPGGRVPTVPAPRMVVADPDAPERRLFVTVESEPADDLLSLPGLGGPAGALTAMSPGSAMVVPAATSTRTVEPSARPELPKEAVDRYALMRRIEMLESRTDAHSQAWARSLRTRIEMHQP